MNILEDCKPFRIHNLRIIELFLMEKTFNVTNHYPSTVKSTTKPWSQARCLHVISMTPGMVTQPLPWAASSNNHFSEEFFPHTLSKPHLEQPEDVFSHPITFYFGEETDTHLATTSFPVVVKSDRVSPQPPFLKTKQPQIPQLLLVRLVP